METKEIQMQAQLAFNTSSSFLPLQIEKIQKRIPLVETSQIIRNVDDAIIDGIYNDKFGIVFDKNTDLEGILEFADVIAGIKRFRLMIR